MITEDGDADGGGCADTPGGVRGNAELRDIVKSKTSKSGNSNSKRLSQRKKMSILGLQPRAWARWNPGMLQEYDLSSESGSKGAKSIKIDDQNRKCRFGANGPI